MTIAKLRELVAQVPIRPNQFRAVDRISDLLDHFEPTTDAPTVIADDHGMVIFQDGDRVEVFCCGRLDGWWIARRSERELMEVRSVQAAMDAMDQQQAG